MEKGNKLNHVDRTDCDDLSFIDLVNIVNDSKNIHQCLIFLRHIACCGSKEQIANLAFNILEKYALSKKQEEVLYELSLITAGEDGEFDILKDEMIRKIDCLL